MAAHVVGKREIAELLGVQPGTARKWAGRGLLPEPDHPPVNGLDAWTVTRIGQWAVATKRASRDEVDRWV